MPRIRTRLEELDSVMYLRFRVLESQLTKLLEYSQAGRGCPPSEDWLAGSPTVR